MKIRGARIVKVGVIVSISLAVVATGGMVLAFLSSASPYVTVAQAKTMDRDGLHIAGDIDKRSMVNRVREGRVEFDLIDEKKDRIKVVYEGAPISNLGSATKVVAVGKMNGDHFASDKMIVKCPSKYEGEGAGDYQAGATKN